MPNPDDPGQRETTPLAYSMKDAAQAAGLSVRTLERLTERGALLTRKVAGRRLVDAASLRALVVGETA